MSSTSVPLAAGEMTSLALTSSGTVISWGSNYYGELGNGTTNTTGCACNPVPSQIPGLSGVTAVIGGYDFNFVLKSDGTLWGFGVNNYGQLGDGTMTNSAVPVQVMGVTSVIGAAASYGTSYAIESNGTLWAWGRNADGEIGNGTQTLTGCLCVPTPTQVSNLSGVIGVAASGLNAMALTSDGTVWTWGDNQFGQVGNGKCSTSSTDIVPSPYHLASPTGITAIAVTTGDMYALASDRTEWDWGNNGSGQLGRTGTTCTSSTDVPGQIPNFSNVVTITATRTGGSGCCSTASAILNDGSVWNWGTNSSCQLGIGTSTASFVPVQVQNLSAAVSVASGDGYSIAARSDGTVWAWGDDSSGSLGDGTTGPFNTTCGDPNSPMTAIQTLVSGVALAPPSAPQSVSATAVTTNPLGSTTVSVSWTPPALSGSSPITSYTMQAVQGGTVVTSSTVSAAVTSGSLSVPSKCTPLTTVNVFATSAAGQGPSAPSASFVDVKIPSSPSIVVILMLGLATHFDQGDSYDPLSVPSYCGLPTIPNHPDLQYTAAQAFDPPSSTTTPDFTDAIAALGAVILPFSYKSSYFSGPTSSTFQVMSYSADDSGQESGAGALSLDQEISTAAAVFPNAHIYAIGESEAALSVIEWFGGQPSTGDSGFYSAARDPRVTGLFTVDGNVNGIKAAGLCTVPLACAFLDIHNASPALLMEMGRRWNNRDTNDQAIEATNTGIQSVFSAIGTRGDIVYDGFDFNSDGRLSQWLCAHSQANGDQLCSAESQDFDTPEPPYPPKICVTDILCGHDWVFTQSSVINYVSSAISTGGLNAAFQGPIAASARSATTMPQSVSNARILTTAPTLGVNVIATGQTLTISGSGFGTTQGQVYFAAPSAQTVAGTVSSWSDSSIQVVVPSSAVTGPVQIVTSVQQAIYAGPLAVESPANGVSQVTFQPVTAALAGQPETLTLTANNSSGAGVANVVISVTDGLGTLSCTTNSSGVCSLSVTEYQSATVIGISGTATVQIPLTWIQPSAQTMTLAANQSILLNGTAATINATVKDASGNPVPNQQVNFLNDGSAPVTLNANQATTNASGVATITATSPSTGVSVVRAITNDNATTRAIQISWSSATVSGVSPNSGPSGGGTSITISGSGFTSSASVYFGGTVASSSFVSSSTLTAVAPAGSGAVDVRVGVGGSFSPLTTSDIFTYVPPTVTSISPNSGPATGGTAVRISGTNFAPGAQVKFGSYSSSSVLVSSTTSMAAISPPGATGTIDITVTTNGATSATSSADRFTFTAVTTPPTVTQIAPKTGPAAGRTVVTVTGTNFVGNSTVSVGTSAGTNVSVQNSTALTFTTPAGSGTVDVRVTTPAGVSPAVTADQFTYQAPPFAGMVAAGWFHNVAARSDGTAWAWGRNNFGQLGNGTTTQSGVPVQVTNLSGAIGVAGGAYHSVALKSDGTVWTWGYNGSGQLGNGTTTNSTAPVQVSSMSAITAVAAGCNFTVALKSDGTVWDWGENGYGQLGNGTTTNSSTPVQVSNLSGVTAIAGGCDHSLALKSDGTVWTWGDNHNGQLGIGTTTNSSKPVQVSSLANIISISGGEYHSLAARSDGTAWAWGYNQNGQLGNGTTKQSTTPVQVSTLTNVKTVAGGGGHSLALTSSGVIWAWGLNSYGQLGNGTTTNSSTPVQVSNLSNGAMISGGVDHSIATTTAGLAWDWGNNQFGQLGNGTTSNSSTPIQVSNLTSV